LINGLFVCSRWVTDQLMLTMKRNGSKSIRMNDGSSRTFLEDGDIVSMTAVAVNKQDGIRIRFGDCDGQVLPPTPITS
jgi:fumarylacetoacetase